MKRVISAAICIVLISVNIFAAELDAVKGVLSDTVQYIYSEVSSPQVGSIGGEWAVIGLARSGIDIPDRYYQEYYSNLKAYVTEHSGVLHEKKNTEYSRVILALTAIGKNPADICGYNLLTALGDYEKTVWQGINGPVWALIALDSGNYTIPENASAQTQATRELYIEYILKNQLPDGGWPLSGEGAADVDITGMVLQALAKYQEDERVKSATQKALLCVSDLQNDNGGFSSYTAENSESCVQIIVALCELGIPLNDIRFVKNDKTLLDNLMVYYSANNGFKHTLDGSTDLMATEQGLYCFAAINRILEGKSSLYRMNDAISISEYSGKAENEKVFQKKNFDDIAGCENRAAIEALAGMGIINGKTETEFEPYTTMTRAEFATIIVNGLNIPASSNAVFSDVPENAWYYSYVNTAYDAGIVSGISETEFNPAGTITREEAAAMTARAAEYCGMSADMELFVARDVLAEFFDYVKISDWAVKSVAFCISNNILSDSVLEIQPKQAVTRAEIAQMLFNMLSAAQRI